MTDDLADTGFRAGDRVMSTTTWRLGTVDHVAEPMPGLIVCVVRWDEHECLLLPVDADDLVRVGDDG